MNYLKEATNRLVLVGTAAFALDKHHPKSELNSNEGEGNRSSFCALKGIKDKFPLKNMRKNHTIFTLNFIKLNDSAYLGEKNIKAKGKV